MERHFLRVYYNCPDCGSEICHNLLNLLMIKEGQRWWGFCPNCGEDNYLNSAMKNATSLLELLDSTDPHLAEKLRPI